MSFFKREEEEINFYSFRHLVVQLIFLIGLIFFAYWSANKLVKIFSQNYQIIKIEKTNLINLQDAEALKILAKKDKKLDEKKTQPYIMHLFFQKEMDEIWSGGNNGPKVIVENFIVETFITQDNHGQCFLMFSDLSYQEIEMEKRIDNPSLSNNIYGMIKVPCKVSTR